jgi:hypothetical protein
VKQETLTAKQYRKKYVVDDGLTIQQKPRKAPDLTAILRIGEQVCGAKVEAEVRFHETRRWRFDWAWPALKVALEYEGIAGKGKSRHSTLVGYTEDTIKYAEAQLSGWIVLRMTALTPAEQIVDLLTRALQSRMKP